MIMFLVKEMWVLCKNHLKKNYFKNNMKIEKLNSKIKYLYHYTAKENVSKIMKDEAIISKDQYVFFTKSLKDSITAFEREMMIEGKPYIDVDGNLQKRKQ